MNFEYVMDFELERVLWKNKDLKEEKLFRMFCRLRGDHAILRKQFMEDIVLQYGEQVAKEYL